MLSSQRGRVIRPLIFFARKGVPVGWRAKVSDWHRRCESCGSILDTAKQKHLQKHLGHRLRLVTYLHINEWLRIKLGWL